MEFAQSQVQQNERASNVFRKFARVNLRDAESGVHELFRKYGYTVPVNVESLQMGDGRSSKLPFVRLSSWAQWLLDSGRIWRLLCGCSSYESMQLVLIEFWKRWEKLHPNHDVFRLGLDLARTIPYFTHQDEGRSLKHEAIWVFSVHGCLGRGTAEYIRRGKNQGDIQNMEFGLNFLGNTWSNHLLLCTMMKTFSAKYPGSMKKVMDMFASDASFLATEGITSQDNTRRVFMIHVATKGDLPASAKIANLQRSFSHCPRAASSKTAANGICHLCLGGQEADNTGRPNIPYEDFAYNPAWLTTVDAVLPWATTPPILHNAVLDQAKIAHFFETDLWHNVSLGAGKHFLASGFVSALERLNFWPQQSVESKFQFLTAEFRQFCKDNGISPHMDEISRATMAFITSKSSPVGQWSKGSVTTHMMKYLEYFCDKYVVGKTLDPVMLAIVL